MKSSKNWDFLVALESTLPPPKNLTWVLEVTGAGASFPAPLYYKWSEAYLKESGVKVNYQSVGSGNGVRQIQALAVDFGATDAPLENFGNSTAELVSFPTAIGGVVPVVNLKNVVPGQLRLTGQLLAEIYLGNIRNWSDGSIQKINPGLDLPNEQIMVIQRADGSGTTALFTGYLSAHNQAWAKNFKSSPTVDWPIGVGVKGNEGVAALLSRLPNTIGYVEYSLSKRSRLAQVSLKNSDGFFVKPSAETIQSASENADWRTSLHPSLIDQRGALSWPIVGVTSVLMHRVQLNPRAGKEVLNFFNWTHAHGDSMASDLGFLPIPEDVKKSVVAGWHEIRDSKGKSLWNAP